MAESSKPAASVIMPIYNAGKYLDAAIESILSQTFTDFELLLLNDGSTDGSLERLQHYAKIDKRCKVFSWPNKGLVATQNEGIKLASAEIIFKMDQDDISRPLRMEKQMRYLESHPECIVLATRVQLIDSEGLPIMEMGERYVHEDIDRGNMSGEGSYIFDPTIAMRKNAVLSVGAYRSDYEYAEDLDLWLRMAEQGRLSCLPEVLVDYRQHLKSMGYAGRDKQLASTYASITDAKRRRGLPEDASWRTSLPDIAKPTVSEVHQKWAWWALSGGNIATARKHAWEAIKKHPLNFDNIKLLVCALRGR
jgi:glycosyltransferase involved in cell wall biosynthesis